MQKKNQDDAVLFIPGTILNFRSWMNLDTFNVHLSTPHYTAQKSIKSYFSDWELLNKYPGFADFMLIRVKSNTGGLFSWTKWAVVIPWGCAWGRPVVAMSLSLAGHMAGLCDRMLGVRCVCVWLGVVHFVVFLGFFWLFFFLHSIGFVPGFVPSMNAPVLTRLFLFTQASLCGLTDSENSMLSEK